MINLDQIKLYDGTGAKLNKNSGKRFSLANDGYTNIDSIGLAISGYSVDNISQL
jgi:hypothetical protein